MEQIAIQGIAGCYHETAARGYFADREIEVLPCLSFDELFARMAADPALLGIAAIENTIAGSLLPNHERLQQSRARSIGEQKLRISHVLAALPGQTPDDIAEVRSHPIALMQCGDVRRHKAVGSGIACFRLGVDLPLDGLAVCLRIDVRLFEKAKRYTLGVQVFV